MPWSEASFRWRRQKRWDQMTATRADTHCQASGRRWVYLEGEPVWGNEVLRQEIASFPDQRQRNNKSLSLSLEELSSLNSNHFTTNDFYSGWGRGLHYSPRACLRTRDQESKATSFFHFLDHMIIPIHVGNNHWFPAHLDIKEWQMTFLDSLHSYSSKCHARHEMLIWKFNCMAWERHVAKEFPIPNWYLSPADFTRPDDDNDCFYCYKK